jgi:natural product precursor
MRKIKINNFPKRQKLRKEEMKNIRGGYIATGYPGNIDIAKVVMPNFVRELNFTQKINYIWY